MRISDWIRRVLFRSEGPPNLHFRPHVAELCDAEAGCLPLLVTNVYRKGGSWRVEGRFAGLDQPIEVEFTSQTDDTELGLRNGTRLARGVRYSTIGVKHTAQLPHASVLSRKTDE